MTATQKAFLKARELGTQDGATDDKSDQYILTELEILEVLQMHADDVLSATEEAAFKAGWKAAVATTFGSSSYASVEEALAAFRQSKAGSVK